MTKETKKPYGAESTLVGQVHFLLGQAGWGQMHDERVCADAELRSNMVLLAEGQASIVLVTPPSVPRLLSQRQKFIKFYREVFGLGKEAQAALKGMNLKTEADLPACLLILGDDILSLRQAIDKVDQYWPDLPTPYAYDRDNLESISIPEGYARPTGSYLIYHSGEVSSDKAYKGTSYKASLTLPDFAFMIPREYVVLWAWVLWNSEQNDQKHARVFLDQSGWSWLCATWPDGRVVDGSSFGSRLLLGSGNPDDDDAGGGPRRVRVVSR